MKHKVNKHYLAECKAAMIQGAAFNDENGHIYLSKDGNVVEMKYCYRCKKWHTLDCFGRYSSQVDGLNPVCKECDRIYQRNRNRNKRKKASYASNSNKESMLKSIEELNDIMSSHLHNINSEYRNTIDKYVATIEELKKQIEEYKSKSDVFKANIKDFERALMTRNDITPRMLFDAIKKRDFGKDLVFYCKDTAKGLTYPIKPDIN